MLRHIYSTCNTLFVFLFVLSLAWMIPLNKYLVKNEQLLVQIDNYQPANFIVTRSIERMATTSNEDTHQAYLLGSINEHKELKYDDGQLHKRRELSKLYPVGSNIKILFNKVALFDNKQTIPVIIPYVENAKLHYTQRVSRYINIKYTPLFITIVLFFSVVVYRWRKNPKHLPKEAPANWIE